MQAAVNRRPLISAGTMLGIGMGGFVDGIVFHQLLQAHNMLSAKYQTKGLDADQLVVNLEINMFWDGLFHAGTWIMTAVGIAMLWSAARRSDVPLSSRTFLGSLLLGWGMFNLVEGTLDHHFLHIHHVVETEDHLIWDISFLAASAVLVLIGLAVIRAGRGDVAQTRAHAAETSPT
jgi:uncharacterized membrane protein